MVKQNKSSQAVKLLDETIKISKKKGNGILRFMASTDKKGNLFRYSLAYINTNICNKDNGRVLGYDNNHGYHHKHYMGTEEKVDFVSFEDIKERFEVEWREIHDQYQK
jgi:hypothetical protein